MTTQAMFFTEKAEKGAPVDLPKLPLRAPMRRIYGALNVRFALASGQIADIPQGPNCAINGSQGQGSSAY